MKKIVLIRHAEAANNNLDDSLRSLNNRGIEQLKEITVKDNPIPLEGKTSVLVSSAVRTQQTFQAIKPFLNTDEIEIQSNLYLASKEILLLTIQDTLEKYDNLVIIAHNPGLSDLLSYLTFDEYHCETASIHLLEVNASSWEDIEAYQNFNVTRLH